jgi:hypothetical protein
MGTDLARQGRAALVIGVEKAKWKKRSRGYPAEADRAAVRRHG